MPEPVEADGTSEGAFNTENPTTEVYTIWDSIIDILSCIISWWTIYWPRVHLLLSFVTCAGGIAILHISIDLLFDLRFEESSVETPIDDQMTEMQSQAWSESVAEATIATGPLQDSLRATATVMNIGLWITSVLLTSPLPEPYKWAAMVVYLAIFSSWVMAMLISVEMGLLPSDFLVGIFSAWLNGASMDIARIAGLGIVLNILWRRLKEVSELLKDWGTVRLRWGIFGVAYYFFIIAMLYIIWVRYYEISIAGYLGEQ